MLRTRIPKGLEFAVIHRACPADPAMVIEALSVGRNDATNSARRFGARFGAAAGLKRHRGAVSRATTAILQTTLRRINSLSVFMDFWD